MGNLLRVYATALLFPRLCKRFVFSRQNNRGISSCSCQEEDIVQFLINVFLLHILDDDCHYFISVYLEVGSKHLKTYNNYNIL